MSMLRFIRLRRKPWVCPRGSIFLPAALVYLLLSVSLAWADSCPYCGQSYGEAAPGDESRVYALRAEHEASCSYRSSGSSSSGGSYSSGWTRRDQEEYEQALLLEEQERQRQEAERKRKERLKQEAQDRAEQQVRKLEWERKKSDLASLLKGASPLPGQEALKTTGGANVILTPRGVLHSEMELKTQEEKENAERTQIINPGTAMPASVSAPENMRRAFWLYQKAALAPTPQEAAFLLRQADAAAQGQALQVVVPKGAELPPLTADKIEAFQAIQTEIAEQQISAEMLGRQKRGAEDKKNLYQRKVTDLENRLKEIRAKKEQVPPPAAADSAENPPLSSETPAPVQPAAEKTPVAETKPEPEKDPAEEDLLAQLLEAQKQMQSADQDLNQLLASQAEGKSKLAESEKKLGALLEK